MSQIMKPIFIAVALGMLLLLLAGCGQQRAEISAPQEVSPPTTADTAVSPSEPAPPAATPTAAAVAPPPSPSPAPFMMVPEIGIHGKGGFNPAELSLEAGDTVIWVNYDSQGVILSFAQNGREVFSSSFIAPKATYTHIFEQPGIYTYQVAKYGVTGRIVVR